jgi:hypothetical protein
MTDYKKIASRGLKSARQIGAEMKPSVAGGARKPRSINDYAKGTPADASGKGQIGYNLHSMGRANK